MGRTDTIINTKEWNGFGFKLITKSDYPAVLKHLEDNFYNDEPFSKLLGVTDDRIADMSQKYADILDLNHGSFYAYPLGQPEKIAALLILWLHKKGEDLPEFEPRSPLTIMGNHAIVQFDVIYNIHDKRGVDTYPELYLISSDRQFRGKGLATEMYQRGIAKYKSEGFKFVASTFTNPLSRAIGEKLGFKEVFRMAFSDLKKQDGSAMFSKEDANGHFVNETILDFE